jgi:HTH-type transcriptional regulator/antitoxin HigA
MRTREETHSDLAIPPGEYLAEVLEEIGMSQADLARRMGRPAQAINEIIRGNKSLTPETALQLEHVVDVPAHLLPAFPYKEMVDLSCVAPAHKAEDRVRELRRFFGVASLAQLGEVPAYAPAFRVGGGTRPPSSYGLAAWLHCGYVQARETEVSRFDQAGLLAVLPALRDLTLAPAETVASTLRSELGNCGVVFALFPHFPKTYAHGATFWIAPREKAVLLSSARGKWADIFWFSLFHELGHIALHGNATFVEIEGASGTGGSIEDEADAFARDTLVPGAEYAVFAAARDLSDRAIVQFAASVSIHPGIVVGRLQYEGLLGRDRCNNLRERYDFLTTQAPPVASEV